MLSMWRSALLLTLILAVEGIALASCPDDKPVPTKVTIDEHNRLLLNGKPWFPLCLSPGPPLRARDPKGRDGMAVIKAAGMNSFRVGASMSTPEDIEANEDYLDWIAEHGMYAFPNLREISVFHPQAPKRKEQLREVVTRFRCHPALAVWKTKDEPAWGEPAEPVDGMLAAYKFLKEIDPDHPAWINHAPRNTVEIWREYCKACDITGIDIYPVSVPMGGSSHLPNKEISVVGDYVERITEAVDGKKPIFMVLQVGWSGATPPKRVRVFPTFHQERYMVYQAIIKGARGLLFFGSQVALEGRDAEMGFNWTFFNEVLTPLMREIGEGTELHSALLAPNSMAPLKMKGAPDIEFAAREVGPFLYILAAKREGVEAPVTFSGEALKGEIEVMFEGRKLEAQDGAFTDRFGPNDVHVYKLRR
jgi:hypothetical protein